LGWLCMYGKHVPIFSRRKKKRDKGQETENREKVLCFLLHFQ